MIYPERDIPLPEGWEVRSSRTTGLTYYLNVLTKQSQWEKPGALNDTIFIRCSHILIKHEHSRRPTSWRNEPITRSKEEALELIRALRREIYLNPHSFVYAASKYSDCSSAQREGDLGLFSRGEMDPIFEDVSFKLQVGEVSRPIETESGFHLIFRTV